MVEVNQILFGTEKQMKTLNENVKFYDKMSSRYWDMGK